MASWPPSRYLLCLTCATLSWHLTWPCPQMAVLEIQANGDTRVTEEAIAGARHSLSDPNMRVSSFQVGLLKCSRQAWRCSEPVLLRHVKSLSHKCPPTRRALPGVHVEF